MPKRSVISLVSVLVCAHAQMVPYEVGFGPSDQVFVQANQNPLNKTSVSFPGFNVDADAGSTDNATSGQWTWNASLSIVNTDTNETNYPISSATNSTSNVINIAYTLDFPGDQLPVQNYTNWTICSNIVDVPWTDEVLQRASNDPGDCSTVLGASILNQLREGWRGSAGPLSSSGCPSGPVLSQIAGFSSLTTNGYAYYTSSIMSWFSDPHNRSSPLVGLKSGQIFSYERSNEFDASDAQAAYDQYASALRMMVLTLTPSQGFKSNHSGVINSGEVRTFCTILNKDDTSHRNAASVLSASHAMGLAVTIWTLLFTMDLV